MIRSDYYNFKVLEVDFGRFTMNSVIKWRSIDMDHSKVTFPSNLNIIYLHTRNSEGRMTVRTIKKLYYDKK